MHGHELIIAETVEQVLVLTLFHLNLGLNDIL